MPFNSIRFDPRRIVKLLYFSYPSLSLSVSLSAPSRSRARVGNNAFRKFVWLMDGWIKCRPNNGARIKMRCQRMANSIYLSHVLRIHSFVRLWRRPLDCVTAVCRPHRTTICMKNVGIIFGLANNFHACHGWSTHGIQVQFNFMQNHVPAEGRALRFPICCLHDASAFNNIHACIKHEAWRMKHDGPNNARQNSLSLK